MIEIFIRQINQIKAGLPGHHSQFSGSNDVIHVLQTVIGQFFSAGLILFGQAGHYGNHHNLLGINTELLRIKRFGNGAEHFMG
ncbi:hypothetical protein SDC9_152402 [bioreactor metagenome]|uniref:Uncharacterized protein n=1 Tax=bioreactor metagenome TaxID=1076179 RepID=A0A645EV92_9ZZZZ